MTPSFHGVAARNVAEKLREFSWSFLREMSLRKKWSVRKFAFVNFCSRSKRETLFLGLICWADGSFSDPISIFTLINAKDYGPYEIRMWCIHKNNRE